MNRFHRQFFILSLWFYVLLSALAVVFTLLSCSPYTLCTFCASDAKTLMVFVISVMLACELLTPCYQPHSHLTETPTGDYHDTHH